jgi:photosystem II stability/assembly factor-like uncharacterized protein
MAALRGISFPTRGHGWLLCVGEPGVGAEEKGVYTTTDLGRHWLPVAESRFLRHIDFGGLGVGGYPAGISFLADGHGILWESRGTLFVTHDGGHHWFPKSKAVRPQVDVGLWGEMVKPRYALVLLDGLNGHRVIMSSDAGRTWRIAHRWMR